MRLKYFRRLCEINELAWQKELARMDRRESIYRGDGLLRPLTARDVNSDGSAKTAPHVRNVVAENIEAQVSSVIPRPRVTARRRRDEKLAAVAENMIAAELDRLPMEEINDLVDRTVKIQGGAMLLVEWDNTAVSHSAVGEITVTPVHPRQFIPQDGVFTSIDDMDYFFLRLPQTKEYIRRRYGADTFDGEGNGNESGEGMVTQYVAYYKNGLGGIGRFSWVNDTVLEDLEDYQARYLRRCDRWGAAVTDGDEGPHCHGGEFTLEKEEEEILFSDLRLSDGTVIPACDAKGRRTGIPYYEPGAYPLVLIRNVSMFGQLLGQSDVDRLESTQNVINRIETKMIERFIKAGTRITLPDRADIRIDPEDSEVLYIGSAADKSLIDVYDFKGDMTDELEYARRKYEEARQIIGITDSYQGRNDPTAVSGRAKEIAVARSEGMLESKRIMKEAAYARLFELIFKFSLAYKDEPRPVAVTDSRGGVGYDSFDRRDYLEMDDAGEYFYNDGFLFSCDAADTLTSNRQAMWSEAASYFTDGAMGDPERAETQIMFWTMMEELHHPLAGMVRRQLQRRLEDENTGAAAGKTAEERSGRWDTTG